MLVPNFSLYEMIELLIGSQSDIKIFCPNMNSTIGTMLDICKSSPAYCSGLFDLNEQTMFEFNDNFTSKARSELIDNNIAKSRMSYNISFINTLKPEVYSLEDLFQFSAFLPSFDFNAETKRVQHKMVEDKLAMFKCSRFSEDRNIPKHLMQLEQSLNSLHLGCYAVTVLPDNWQIVDMRYNRWLEANCAVVARIELPPGSIEYYNNVDIPYKVPDQYGSKIDSGLERFGYKIKTENKWHLVVLFKPYSVVWNPDGFKCPTTSGYYSSLEWAEYTYTTFKHRLPSLEEKDLTVLKEKFEDSEWFRMSVFQWQQLMEQMKKTTTPYGVYNKYPQTLPSQENMFLVNVTDKCEQKVLVVESVEELKNSSKLVQLQPTRSKIKLVGHSEETRCLVAEFMMSMGFDEGILKRDTFMSQDFETVRHKLISDIYSHGLIPCMLSRDYAALKTRMRWLNRQLTPIERYVSVERKSSDKTRSRFDYKAEDEWERIYDEIGLRSVYSDQYDQWEQRARKIGLHRPGVTFDFQFDDIIVRCMKNGNVNGTVMGLGKTREMLFAAILRGVKKMLIICPKKLIGTWQDEIDDTIVPFARRARRNWNGEIIDIGIPNVIEYAEDCLPENLTMFNIISYDKLKSIPRDGTFFKCPKCGFVTYSANQKIRKMRCPGHPFEYDEDPMQDKSCVGQLRRWKAANSTRDDNGRLLYQKYKVWKHDGRRVHWDENHPSREIEIDNVKHLIRDTECTVMDTRDKNPHNDAISGGKPRPTMMKRQTRMFDKTQRKIVGYKKEKDKEGVEVEVPIVREFHRKCKGKKFHAKWTFAELLRWRFPMVGIDEVIAIKNPDSQRTQAVNHLTARIRYTDTGTPMKGLPQGIVNYINWTIDREVFPWYRSYDKLGLKRFLTKYKTDVYVAGVETPTGEIVGGKKKQIHKIKNADLFMSEMGPNMIRRKRGEPEVVKDIPDITCVYQDIRLTMDDEHRAFYRQVIEMFIEWWESMKEEEEGKRTGPNLLAKMSYLINAETNPHFMFERLRKKSRNIRHTNKGDEVIARWLKIIKPYKGPPTAKMKKCIEIIKDARLKGDKVLLGSTRSHNLDFGKAICDRKRISSLVVDGRVSLDTKKGQNRSERHLRVQDFRTMNINAMWCGIKALAEGMNIPEANHVVNYDVTWEPADSDQFNGRVIRPQQTKTVNLYYLMHEGTIGEYMVALNYLKSRSHSEGIDGISFDDLTADMIPDIRQYAESIVDGTEDVLKRTMWLKVEQIKKDFEEEAKRKLHSQDEINDEDFDDDYDENGG